MELDAQVCHIWKISDGKVTSFQQYVNTAQLLDVEDALAWSARPASYAVDEDQGH